MKTFLHHIQVNIDPKNLQFYKDLMEKLGSPVITEGEGFAGFALPNSSSIWFMPAIKQENGDYDFKGVNHIGFGASSVEEVDEVVQWLTEKGVTSLFGTPQHRLDFASEPDTTYYQVMFETPDKLLIEVVYTGQI